MKNIFKSTKNRKSFIGAALAAISFFSFNYSPINIISNKIVSAAKYEATETKITEATTTQISATELVSNLKDYFSDSNAQLALNKYYTNEYKTLLFKKIDEMLSAKINNYVSTYLKGYADLKSYFESTSSDDYLDFISSFISKEALPEYSNYETVEDKKSHFYNDLENYVYSSTYALSNADESYKNVKTKLD